VVSGAEARAAETAARREAEAQAAEEAAEARVAETLAQWKSKLGVLEAELEAAERAKAAIREEVERQKQVRRPLRPCWRPF
jgi:hypothetical protein